jgi:hypothetical protein
MQNSRRKPRLPTRSRRRLMHSDWRPFQYTGAVQDPTPKRFLTRGKSVSETARFIRVWSNVGPPRLNFYVSKQTESFVAIACLRTKWHVRFLAHTTRARVRDTSPIYMVQQICFRGSNCGAPRHPNVVLLVQSKRLFRA